MEISGFFVKAYKKAGRLYALNVERRMFMNCFNPLVTLYVNLRLLSIRQAFRVPIFVYGWPKLMSLYGSAVILGGVKMGMIHLNRSWHTAGGPNYMGGPMELNIWGKIVFRGTCKIGPGCKICVGEDGCLDIGDGCRMMTHDNITAYKSVVIGKALLMAHDAQIFDTNYHFVADLNHHRVKRIADSVVIGDNCWVCNGATIMSGVSIPNYTIVASNSLVNKSMLHVPEKSIIGGSPAKLISMGHLLIEDDTILSKIQRYFKDNPHEEYYSLDNN